MDWAAFATSVAAFFDWLGISLPSQQDAIKALLLIAFALATLMILGDIYRGEIQNTLHRVRLVGNPTRDSEYKNSLQLPKAMVTPTLDGTFTNVLIYYRYRDHRGQLRTKRVKTYRARLRIRARFPAATAVGRESDHSYSDEEKDFVAKEKPDLEAALGSEIVAMARSRVDYVNALNERIMNRAAHKWSKLQNSKLRRLLPKMAGAELQEPQPVGVLVKFHFPIDPYFLLYRHPEPNIRSTAWLTVLTSLFAIFMQLVYAPRPPFDVPSRGTPARQEATQTVEPYPIIEARPVRSAIPPP
jgi:hypothetical protein